MQARVRFHERNLSVGRHQASDEFEKSMNTMLGQFVADLIAAKGAGQYQIGVKLERDFASDYSTFVLDARLLDGSRPGFPYPVWENVPEWASFWTVGVTGRILIHEFKPQVLLGVDGWESRGRVAALERVEVPIGIDWRTLCFERPTSVMLRNKLAVEDARQSLSEPSGWGMFEAFRKFLP